MSNGRSGCQVSKRIKIVGLGDSLTVGVQTQLITTSQACAPYTIFLEDLARQYRKEFCSFAEVEILNRGISGELTSDMLERFEGDVVQEAPEHVIIIGGTNDLGWGLDPSLIIRNLKTMYNIAQDNRIQPVACTIPSILGFDELIPTRIQTNFLIRAEAERRRIALVDIFGSTSDPTTNRLCQEYSGDGLHLNSKGYRKISETIFQEWLRGIMDQNLVN